MRIWALQVTAGALLVAAGFLALSSSAATARVPAAAGGQTEGSALHPTAQKTRGGGPGLHPTAHKTRGGGPGLHPTAHKTRGGGPALHPTAQKTRGGGPALHPTAQKTRGGGPGLQAPSAFANIADPAQRSAALFVEAGKVLLHPRCVNCHPAGDRPLQGDTGALHEPWVRRGPDGFGVPALRCSTCHPAANYDAVGMPGHPKWHLAPAEMAWEGRSLAQICEQIKDPARNGGHSLKEIVEHMAHDSLVGWGWTPGAGRQPAPSTQAAFGALIKAWAETGAACPGP